MASSWVRICCASAPLPAPNSQTSEQPVAASACATWRPSVRPNQGESSGAVTKSLPLPGMAPNLTLSLA